MQQTVSSADEAEVAAAILNWNGGDLVVSCLRSLMRQTHVPQPRIVVDNASTDGSLERLQAEDPNLVVIANPRNVGFAKAANQAVAACRARWLLLLNLDIELESDYVARLLMSGESSPQIGALTGKLLKPRRDGTADIIDSTGHLLFRNGWAANRGEGAPDQPRWERAGEIFGVCAAAPLYRVEMLRDVSHGCAQPFDERFVAYIEDVDLDWRMRWLGWQAWYEPAVAWHHRSATGTRRSAFMLRHILKNRLLLVANNDLWPQGLLRVPTVALFALLTAVQFGTEAGRALLGLLDFMQLLPASVQRRRFLRRRRRVSASAISRWMQPFPYRRQLIQKLRTSTDRASGQVLD